MMRLLERLEVIEATDVLEIDVSWINGNCRRVLFHSVQNASADRMREMAAPRRYLALVCFLHHAWRNTLDQAVDMYGKLLERNRRMIELRLNEKLKSQRRAIDRIVYRYRRLGTVLLDPDISDAELRTRLLETMSATDLREDQIDLENWTPGNSKARFAATAGRHGSLSRFVAPILE